MKGKVGWERGRPRAPFSPETRAKLSASQHRNWANPEYRARLLKAIRAASERKTSYKPPIPPYGTSDRRVFEKIRRIIGTAAARAALGIGQ